MAPVACSGQQQKLWERRLLELATSCACCCLSWTQLTGLLLPGVSAAPVSSSRGSQQQLPRPAASEKESWNWGEVSPPAVVVEQSKLQGEEGGSASM